MASLDGKVYALTGAASGIGLATAKLFAARGARISIADVQEKQLHDAVAQIKAATPVAEVITQVVDVRDKAACEKWVADTVKHFGRLDGAANLAGVFKSTALLDDDGATWDFMMSVNLAGTRNCIQAQVPHLKAGGAIVNAASILGIQGDGDSPAYSVSKHGVVGLTRSTAKEYGKKGIRVNAIAPGFIQTPMLAAAMANHAPDSTHVQTQGTHVALGRMGKAEEVAPLIAFLISDDASFISGQIISIDGGWHC